MTERLPLATAITPRAPHRDMTATETRPARVLAARAPPRRARPPPVPKAGDVSPSPSSRAWGPGRVRGPTGLVHRLATGSRPEHPGPPGRCPVVRASGRRGRPRGGPVDRLTAALWSTLARPPRPAVVR